MVTLAGGFQSFEGGPISYNIPYTKEHSLAETIEHWQFVDRLCGAYTERGVTINREPFGPLTGTLVPPSIAITVMLIEGLLAATQGVRSLTLGYGQVGNLVQDVAALRALRSLGEEYLPEEVTVTTVFHEWMGGFPPDEARASGVIGLRGATAAVAKPDKVITKSPRSSRASPTKEANASGLRTTRQLIDMLIEQDIDLGGIDDEQALIERTTRALMDAVFEAGDGDVVQGVINAFDSGRSTCRSHRVTRPRARSFRHGTTTAASASSSSGTSRSPTKSSRFTPRGSASARPHGRAARSRSAWSPTTSTPSAMVSSSVVRRATPDLAGGASDAD